jgi:hypothetical protein
MVGGPSRAECRPSLFTIRLRVLQACLVPLLQRVVTDLGRRKFNEEASTSPQRADFRGGFRFSKIPALYKHLRRAYWSDERRLTRFGHHSFRQSASELGAWWVSFCLPTAGDKQKLFLIRNITNCQPGSRTTLNPFFSLNSTLLQASASPCRPRQLSSSLSKSETSSYSIASRWPQ